MIRKNMNINGKMQMMVVDPDSFLSDTLREQLKLTGTKIGCGQGQCGGCSVILDGKVVRFCITKMSRVPDEACITTIEGIGGRRRRTSFTPFSLPGRFMGRPSAVSAVRALSSRPRPCWMSIPARPARMSGTGFKNTGTHATAPDTNPWWMR